MEATVVRKWGGQGDTLLLRAAFPMQFTWAARTPDVAILGEALPHLLRPAAGWSDSRVSAVRAGAKRGAPATATAPPFISIQRLSVLSSLQPLPRRQQHLKMPIITAVAAPAPHLVSSGRLRTRTETRPALRSDRSRCRSLSSLPPPRSSLSRSLSRSRLILMCWEEQGGLTAEKASRPTTRAF